MTGSLTSLFALTSIKKQQRQLRDDEDVEKFKIGEY